jgi:hypothetical protein
MEVREQRGIGFCGQSPLYRQVGKGKARRYQKVNLGRGRRPADLTGPYFLRYRWLTALVLGKLLATTSTRQSTLRSASRTRYRNFLLYGISGSTCGLEVARTPQIGGLNGASMVSHR